MWLTVNCPHTEYFPQGLVNSYRNHHTFFKKFVIEGANVKKKRKKCLVLPTKLVMPTQGGFISS